MSSATIGLVMIVRNESMTLPRLADSLRGQLDFWTIVDTGSTDNTPEIVHEIFAGVPGQLIRDEFKGFGPSRNVALDAARENSDWLLTLDADETIEGDVRAAVAAGDVDAVEARMSYAELTYWRPFLLASSSPWTWAGRAHEWLSLGEATPRLVRTDSFRVVHHADGGNRGDKAERELRLLRADFEENRESPRTAFYLARTHEDLGQLRDAARLYRHRVALGGWEEEAWYAHWRLGVCLLGLGETDEAVSTLFTAWGERPWRAEPLHTLAEHFRTSQLWNLCWEVGMIARRHTAARPDGTGRGPEGDRLFVHEDIYQWKLAYERSICAFYVDEKSTGRRLCDYLLTQSLPPETRQSVRANREYYT